LLTVCKRCAKRSEHFRLHIVARRNFHGLISGILKRVKNNAGVVIKYLYKNYEVYNVGYYPPDKCVWWEAVNLETGAADYHATTKKHLKQLIDESE
jgi:hypothetical protein